MHNVLRIEPVEQPEDRLQIDPRDRGTLVHEVLDRFHHLVLDGTLPQPGPDGWGRLHRDTLLELFDEEAAQLEQHGNVGRTAF